jgi:hypothetical protein
MLRLGFFLSLVFFVTKPLQAQFEGSIEMSIIAPQGKGTMTISVSKLGQRTDILTSANSQSVIVKSSHKTIAIILSDATKTYSEIDLKEAIENAAKVSVDDSLKVEKVGMEKVAGYMCTHVKITGEEIKMEMWTTKEILDFATYQRLQGQNPQLAGSAMSKALRAAKADGFPVKVIQNGDGVSVQIEVAKVSKKKIPPSLFEIPLGYTKAQ